VPERVVFWEKVIVEIPKKRIIIFFNCVCIFY
jgi:hypothetical protein